MRHAIVNAVSENRSANPSRPLLAQTFDSASMLLSRFEAHLLEPIDKTEDIPWGSRSAWPAAAASSRPCRRSSHANSARSCEPALDQPAVHPLREEHGDPQTALRTCRRPVDSFGQLHDE